MARGLVSSAMRQVLLVLVVLGLTAPPSAAQRLSGDVIPEHYTLWFAPNLKAATFEGRTTIQARVAGATKAITLHAAELQFGEVRVTSRGRIRGVRPAHQHPRRAPDR